MFMIYKKYIDGQEIIILETEKSHLSVVKTLGGTVLSLGINHQEIISGDSDNNLTENPLFRGRFLFPFNDRIPKGIYAYKGQKFQFPINCNGKDSIHGLIYNRTMDEYSAIENRETVSLVLETVINENEFPGYPFNICLRVEYTLSETSLGISFKITNPGTYEAPYALGWHPYFTFGKIIDTAVLKFSSSEYYAVNEQLYYEGNHYTVDETEFDFTKGQLIGDRELDMAISLKGEGEFKLSDDDKTIKMNFSEDLFPALQLFIPDDRKSIAIEPISAPSDTFNYPETGLKIIEPGEVHCGSLTLGI